MVRASLLVLACILALPAYAEVPSKTVAKGAADKPLINPSTLAVNETALKKAQAETEARAKAWDAKLKKTMDGVCKGC